MNADPQKTPHHEQPKAGSPAHAEDGYERSDAQAGATYRAGFYILGTMFVVAALLVPAYRLLVRVEAGRQQPPAYVVKDAAPPPEAAYPRLVTSEPAVLAEYRAKEQEFLDGWGWVEKDRGIARMPVDEAVRIVGERGALPVFAAPADAGAPAAAPGAAPAPAAGARR